MMLHELVQMIRVATANRLNFPTPFPKAAPFAGQHVNPKRNAERKARRAVGRRQYLRTQKSMRRAMKENTCAAS